MTDVIYTAPDNSGKKLTITRGVIQGTEKPIYETPDEA
jgi:purine nucleoside phosphorylase